MQFRRRREGRTDYRQRLTLLRSGKVRAVVRKSLSGTMVQLVEYSEAGDMVLAQASYNDLRKLGWEHSLKDTTASYLVGLLAGVRAKKADIGEAILDIGLQEPKKGSRVFAALKGLIDAGLEIPHGEEVIPSDDRIEGAHKDDGAFKGSFERLRSTIMEM
jgi:large subunit ribosomal protein L18